MIADKVVAALAAEGHSRDRIRAAMAALADQDWREEDEDWSQRDLDALRKQLGTPALAPPAQDLPHDQADVPVNRQDPSHSTFEWAADLAWALDRTTGGKTVLTADQARRAADHLLHWSGGPWGPPLHDRTDDASYVPDFTVAHWADGVDEALRAGTNGEVALSRDDLHVAANLLLHAEEDDWVPQAGVLRAAHELSLRD